MSRTPPRRRSSRRWSPAPARRSSAPPPNSSSPAPPVSRSAEGRSPVMRIRALAFAALLLPLLGACSSVVEAVKGPELAPVGYPAALVPQQQEILPLASAREPQPG